jgi:hypothetical protein
VRRTWAFLPALVLSVVATTASVSTAKSSDGLVAFVSPGDECTTSKTVFVAVDRSGVHQLQCEGRAYDGPLSASQYQVVFTLAGDLFGSKKRTLSEQGRRRIRRYAAAVARGENAATFDKPAARAEIEFTVEAFFHDVGHNRRGRFYLSPDFYTKKKTKQGVIRALTGVIDGGDALRPVVETLFERRPHGGEFIYQEAVTAIPQTTTLTVPPNGAESTAEIVIDALLDPAITACAPEQLRSGASIPNYLCTLGFVFADGSWKVDRATFEALFVLAPAETTTTTG